MSTHSNLSTLQKKSALFILLISFFAGVLVYAITTVLKINNLSHLMLAWDTTCLVLLAIHWHLFFTTTAAKTHLKAKMQDETRGQIFAVVVVSTFSGLLAVILLLVDKEITTLDFVVALLGMFLSWFLVHTTFTMRYAHLYYGDSESHHHGAGLEFPGSEKPDFIDFAYFSFILGMTFQVSDVEISSRKIRRLSLLHSLISFVFNTVIVALTINAIAGLGSR